MTDVFLERTFDPPLTPKAVFQAAGATSGCFDIYRVTWAGSFLAKDGGRLICRFQAPDAESARAALRLAGADMRVVWPGTIHEAPNSSEAEAPNVLVERSFETPIELEAIQALEEASADCLLNYRVQCVRTFFSLDRRRMVCLYRAPDAESVRLAQRQAGLPVDRTWSFYALHPAGLGESNSS